MADPREQLESALGASYRIDRELGGGGMSRVFLATELGLDRQVVIKVLPQDLAQLLNPERFEREIQIAARLQHPHVVALLSAGQAGGVRYYVMPWIEGESLRARLTREPRPPLAETVRILRDAADGLAYAHARGIVHRDIKPENILLSGDHAVVTDFGVAKALTDAAGGGSGLTSVGLVIGTPAYMAPEQAAADPNVDARADIYALGIIGYEMLAGAAPFEGATPQALLAAHIAKTPVPLAERRPDLPPSLVALMDRCLAKQPEARPEAAAIVRELERLNTSAGTVISHAAAAPRRWGRRHGRVAAVLVIVALAVLGARAWMSRGGTPPAEATLAILPLTPGTPDTALSRLGRELALTLSATLDAIGDFRTLDPLSVLALVPEDGQPLATEAALGIARKLGATRALGGNMVRTGDHVRINLTLISTKDGAVIAKPSLTGPADDVEVLGDSIGWSVLRIGWKGGFTAPLKLSEITTKSLDALRAYLRAEHLVARGDWGGAEAAYAQAVEADTSFLLAYVGLARAQSWQIGTAPDTGVLNRVERGLDRLPEREAFIWRAQLAARQSRMASDSLLREATRRWPDWWPGWFWYGDRLVHDGPLRGHSQAEALRAFERTAELNPGLVPAYDHIFMASGLMSESARRALSMLDSLNPTDFTLPSFKFALDLFAQTPVSGALIDSAETLLRALPGGIPQPFVPTWLPTPDVQLAVNQRLVRDNPIRAAEFARADAALWAARGRWDSALAAADRYTRLSGDKVGLVEEYRYAAVATWLGALPDSLVTLSRARLEPLIEGLPNSSRAAVHWFDGLRSAARHDSAGLSSAREELHRFLVTSQYGDTLRWTQDRSLAAFALGIEGRSIEAGKILAQLEWELADSLPGMHWPSFWGLGIRRLAAARWVAAAGDTAQAIRLLRWMDAVIANPAWFRATLALGGASLLERAELEAASGRREEAQQDFRVFLRYFDDPMPSLAALRTRAERGLAKLEGRKE